TGGSPGTPPALSPEPDQTDRPCPASAGQSGCGRASAGNCDTAPAAGRGPRSAREGHWRGVSPPPVSLQSPSALPIRKGRFAGQFATAAHRFLLNSKRWPPNGTAGSPRLLKKSDTFGQE